MYIKISENSQTLTKKNLDITCINYKINISKQGCYNILKQEGTHTRVGRQKRTLEVNFFMSSLKVARYWYPAPAFNENPVQGVSEELPG